MQSLKKQKVSNQDSPLSNPENIDNVSPIPRQELPAPHYDQPEQQKQDDPLQHASSNMNQNYGRSPEPAKFVQPKPKEFVTQPDLSTRNTVSLDQDFHVGSNKVMSRYAREQVEQYLNIQIPEEYVNEQEIKGYVYERMTKEQLIDTIFQQQQSPTKSKGQSTMGTHPFNDVEFQSKAVGRYNMGFGNPTAPVREVINLSAKTPKEQNLYDQRFKHASTRNMNVPSQYLPKKPP